MTEEQTAKLDKALLNGRKLGAWERSFVTKLANRRGWTLSAGQETKLNEIYLKVTGGAPSE